MNRSQARPGTPPDRNQPGDMMAATYEILVQGNSLEWSGGFLGFANLTLVTTPEGTLLFDTGHYINRGALVAALAARGMVPGDIDRVFLSHIHFDHADNVDLFPHAVVYLGKADWEYVRHPAKDDLFIPWGIHEQLSKNKLELLDHDGDIGGGLTAVKLPGHTPGSMGVRFEHATNGTVVIAGDAIKNLNEVINDRQADAQYQFPVAASLADDEASIAKVVRVADRIIPGHFPELKREGTVFTPIGSQSLEILFK
jgi:glyoxylase-like metal-dependent hydrolase (beta-lactamase superfamily II)